MVTTINFTSRPEIGTAVYIDKQRYQLLEIRAVQRGDLPIATFAQWASACAECGTAFRTVSRLGGKLPSRRCRQHRKPGKVVSGRRKIQRVVVVPPGHALVEFERDSNGRIVLSEGAQTALRGLQGIETKLRILEAAGAQLVTPEQMSTIRKWIDLLIAEAFSQIPEIARCFAENMGIDPNDLDGIDLGAAVHEWLQPTRVVSGGQP